MVYLPARPATLGTGGYRSARYGAGTGDWSDRLLFERLLLRRTLYAPVGCDAISSKFQFGNARSEPSLCTPKRTRLAARLRACLFSWNRKRATTRGFSIGSSQRGGE